MTTIDEVLSTGYRPPTPIARRPHMVVRRASHRIATAVPPVVKRPLDATEWRLKDYGSASVIHPAELVADRIAMDPQTTSAEPIQILWNVPAAGLPARLDDVLLCVEYRSGNDPLALVNGYVARAVPSLQVVVAGDLRAMPSELYGALAQAGVFLKHVRYAGMADDDRRRQLTNELRLVYQDLLGASRTAPRSGRPLDYTPGTPRLNDEEFAEFIERLKDRTFSSGD